MDLAMAECGLQRSSVQASGSIKCVSGAELILQLSCRKLECQAQSDECLSRRGLASGGGGGGAIVKRYSDHERKPRGRLMRQATVETTESRRRVLSEGRHRHWRSCEVDETRMDAGRRPTGSCEPSASVASPACASLAHSQCETIRSTNSQRPSFLDLTACPSPSSASVGEPGRRYPSAAPVCSQSAGLPQVVSVATGVAVGKKISIEAGHSLRDKEVGGQLSRRARIIIVVTTLLLLFMCFFLVGVTLRLAPLIDEMGKLHHPRPMHKLNFCINLNFKNIKKF